MKTVFRVMLLLVGVGFAALGEAGFAPPSAVLPFVENRGQAPKSVLFYKSDGVGGRFTLMADGRLVHGLPTSTGLWTLTERLVEARGLAQTPVGTERAATRLNFLRGEDPRAWLNGVPVWRRIELGEPWPGIEVALDASAGRVEKIFTVEPGADAGHIRVAVEGVDELRVDRDGALVAVRGIDTARFSAPIAWQPIDGTRRAVDARYVIEGTRYGFELGPHDRSHAVVIDPFVGSSWLGGSGNAETIRAIDVHPTTGNVYVAGVTAADMPVTGGAAQGLPGGNQDAFVAAFTPDLQALIAVTYLGGTGDDYASDVKIHPVSGEIYVTGSNASGGFPGTVGGYQTSNPAGTSGAKAAFIARLSADLGTLVQATYYGGSGGNVVTGTSVPFASLAFEPTSGDLYLASITNSSALPGVAGGAQASVAATLNGFVARFAPSLAAGSLVQATYFGRDALGSGASLVLTDVAVGNGSVYVAGHTRQIGLPGTTGAAQPVHAADGGVDDFFVARFALDLTTLTRSTYLGGTGLDNDGGNSDARVSIAIDPIDGDIYLAGASDSADFPGVGSGFQPARTAAKPTVIARLSADLGSLLGATYLGLTGTNSMHGLRVDPVTGEVYVSARTSGTVPGTAGGAQDSPPATRSFAARLNGDLSVLAQSTYLGGLDVNSDLAASFGTGTLFVGGAAGTAFATRCTSPGAQSTIGGTTDGAIVAITADLAGDGVPDAFAFSDQSDVATSTLMTSNAVAMTGLNRDAAVTVTGGSYSINGGAFTTAAGFVCNGDSVRVQHTSSATLGATVDTVLSVGGVSDTFSSTTIAAVDTTPDAFTFVYQTGVAVSTTITSNTITVSGINSPAPISVVGGRVLRQRRRVHGRGRQRERGRYRGCSAYVGCVGRCERHYDTDDRWRQRHVQQHDGGCGGHHTRSVRVHRSNRSGPRFDGHLERGDGGRDQCAYGDLRDGGGVLRERCRVHDCGWHGRQRRHGTCAAHFVRGLQHVREHHADDRWRDRRVHQHNHGRSAASVVRTRHDRAARGRRRCLRSVVPGPTRDRHARAVSAAPSARVCSLRVGCPLCHARRRHSGRKRRRALVRWCECRRCPRDLLGQRRARGRRFLRRVHGGHEACRRRWVRRALGCRVRVDGSRSLRRQSRQHAFLLARRGLQRGGTRTYLKTV